MGCVWFLYREIELRHKREHENAKNKNKLIEWKAFVMGIKSALLLSKLPGYTENVVYWCMLLRMLKSTVNNTRFKIGKYSIVQK